MVSNTDGVGRMLSVMDTLNPRCDKLSAQSVINFLTSLLSMPSKSMINGASMCCSTPNVYVYRTCELPVVVCVAVYRDAS